MTMMRQVLGHGQLAVEPWMLKHDAQPPSHPGRLAREVTPQYPRAPRLNRRQRREQLEQRALAAAIGSEKSENLAARHREAHIRERLALAITKAKPSRLASRGSNARRTLRKLWSIGNGREPQFSA